MSRMITHFDAYYDTWSAQIGALCCLLCRNRRDSLDVAFQSLLRLGGAKDCEIGESEARMLLFKSAVRLCDDYYLKKMRRLPSKKKLLAQNLPFEMTDSLYALLRLPFKKRAALALSHFGFSQSEISEILRVRPQTVVSLLAAPAIPGWEAALDSLLLTEDEQLVMSDRILERFSERSVGVENAIHDARNLFDRAAPLMALGVLALFAFSVFYVNSL